MTGAEKVPVSAKKEELWQRNKQLLKYNIKKERKFKNFRSFCLQIYQNGIIIAMKTDNPPILRKSFTTDYF